MIYVLLWAIVIGVLAAPVIYIVTGSASGPFWDNVASGLVGTAAALIGGVPIALWVDRTIKQKELEKLSKETALKERGLLRLIREELEECRNSLQQRLAANSALVTPPLKSSFWQAASQGGKLDYISNHSLLGKISAAYYWINVVQNAEWLCSKALASAAVVYPDGTTAQRNIFNQCRTYYPRLSNSLDEVIALIDTHI